MLMEHSFVTTLSQSQAWELAENALFTLGFSRSNVRGDSGICFQRGVSSPAKASKISDLPQEVRMEFDRGRVNLAASVRLHRKASQLHRDMLITLARVLEQVVGQGTGIELARATWDSLEASIERSARNATRTKFVIVAFLAVFIIVVLASAMISR